MIAVDTNILVYAHRCEGPWHEPSARALRALDARGSRWAIPWPCVYEFVNIVTHPRIFERPTPLPQALEAVEGWRESPRVCFLGEDEEMWPTLRKRLREAEVRGPLVHDAKIAVLCERHGVAELWSVDRDFSRFAFLKVRNPLTEEMRSAGRSGKGGR